MQKNNFVLIIGNISSKLPDQDKLYNMKLNNLVNSQKQGISDLLSLIGGSNV